MKESNPLKAAQPTTRRCTRCGEVKPLEEFYPHKKGKYGRASTCGTCARGKAQEYHQKNRGRIAVAKKEYNRTRDKERKRESVRAYTFRLRQRILEAYGHACECCGESRREFLGIDHVKGGGTQQRREGLSGVRLYNTMIESGFPKDEYRLLCHNCNLSKGFYGHCPHENLTRQFS